MKRTWENTAGMHLQDTDEDGNTTWLVEDGDGGFVEADPPCRVSEAFVIDYVLSKKERDEMYARFLAGEPIQPTEEEKPNRP